MSLLTLFCFLIVLGIVVWAVNTYLPLPPAFKNIILVVAICVAVFYVLSATGILGSFSKISVPRVH